MSDYNPPSVYKMTIRTARKLHLCFETGREILPGEKYACHQGVWSDWGAHTFHVSLAAEQLRTELNANIKYPDDYIAFGELAEAVHEAGTVEQKNRYRALCRTTA